MWLLVIFTIVGQQKPGPLDAFRANYASIKAGMDFEHTSGLLDGDPSKLWSDTRPQFIETRKSGIRGHWECDGTAEYYRFQSIDEVQALLKRTPPRRDASKVISQVHYVPLTEAIWDGETLASHSHSMPFDKSQNMDSSASLVWQCIQLERVIEEPANLQDGRGPFYWGFTYTFPQIIGAKFSGVEPIRTTSTRGGFPVEVEVYRSDQANGARFQFEVSYDPSIGYLPRFARVLFVSPDQSAITKEMYLVDAKPCKAGGFVPVEWYDTAVMIENFGKSFPNYNADTALTPAGQSSFSRFRAQSIETLSREVALTDLKGVHTISTVGGWIPLRSKPTSLSMSKLKALAGRRFTNPVLRAASPHLDATELNAFDPSSSSEPFSYWRLATVFTYVPRVPG